MTETLRRLSTTLATMFSIVFRTAQNQADHKKLIHHIVELSKKKTSVEIINEAAQCLKDILSYRLFAFVLQKDQGVDVWLDPRMYKKSLESIILNDFNVAGKDSINYLNHNFHPDDPEELLSLKDLIYYELKEESCYCRIYMLSGKAMASRDDEAVSLVLQGCSAALSRQMRIENLKDAAVVDPLTGCYNRRELETQLKRSIGNAVRHKSALSVFMFDLDHFKKINDTYGHLAGDTVLCEIARLVKNNMRSGDILARYGGEEFIAILPETCKAKAMDLADRLRKKLAGRHIVHEDEVIKVTASFGVAEMNGNSDLNNLIHQADTMLYKAKLNGRNTVMPCVMKIISKKESNSKKEKTI